MSARSGSDRRHGRLSAFIVSDIRYSRIANFRDFLNLGKHLARPGASCRQAFGREVHRCLPLVNA
jgi:hypothetical protein